MRLLENKVALITGAGRAKGIGRATALRMAEHGARVVVTDVAPKAGGKKKDSYKFVAQEVGALGGEVIGLEMDVGNAQQVAECVDKIVAEFGCIDILFNNAVVTVGVGPFLETRNDDWNFAYQVNVMGMVNTCRNVIPIMRKRGGGSIINTASIAGIAGQPGFGAYTATKHAVVGLSRSLACEFGIDNIRVNAICPGVIRTQLNDSLIEMTARRHDVTAERARTLLESMAALNRMGEPEEVAEVVVFLASPLASFVSGGAFPITGATNLGV